MRDLTSGNPIKLIFFFTIPLLIGNVFQQFYHMADMIIVGQVLGKNALAAVGATGSLIFLILGFAQGLTAGLSIIVAQRFGAQDYRGVKKSFATGIVLSGVVTVILTLFSWFFMRPILVLMQTPAAIIEDSYTFISIIMWGIVASMGFNLLSNVIRAVGDSRTPLVFLIIATIVNIALDVVLIVYFRVGVAGAGIATVSAQAVAGILCLNYIKRRMPNLQLSRKDFRGIWTEVPAHLKVALPMAFQASIIAIGVIILQSAINGLGTDAVAAQATAGKIDQFATLPMASFGVTMATYTAQNYGARQYQRILTGVRQSLALSVGFSLIGGLTMIVFGQSLVGLFVNQGETEVLRLAQIYFNINGSMYWILAILFIVRYTLQGLGQSMVPTIAGIIELLMRCFAALVLMKSFGFVGAAVAIPLAWVGATIVLLYSYFKAVKRLKHLASAEETTSLAQAVAASEPV